MDTSESYIKMCEGAEEIQGKWASQVGDYLSIRQGEPFVDHMLTLLNKGRWYIVSAPDKGRMSNNYIKARHIWLPRQDQLQEMIEPGLWNKALAFVGFLRTEGKYDIKSYPYQFTSMEQLWLAFVMKELYNKVWDGEGWRSR